MARLYTDSATEESERHWHWSAVQRLVVLGLGSPEASPPARMQAAFALMLAQRLLPGLQHPVLACDPVFTAVDRSVLAGLGWQVYLHALQMTASLTSADSGAIL